MLDYIYSEDFDFYMFDSPPYDNIGGGHPEDWGESTTTGAEQMPEEDYIASVTGRGLGKAGAKAEHKLRTSLVRLHFMRRI